MLCAAGKCGRKATHLAGQTCGRGLAPSHIGMRYSGSFLR
ncbi:hypothetical protein VO64_4994 [Pseudomonas synxantha]|uniref:Threonine synthase n=1 Tax=Pseudomonas synxantha TaxID=47883 RepID=A0AAU8U1R7_9PSED|nr:hypothetical protein VO64_4994 [Pseudomonas synxantha]